MFAEFSLNSTTAIIIIEVAIVVVVVYRVLFFYLCEGTAQRWRPSQLAWHKTTMI